jgi:hypothetical protein
MVYKDDQVFIESLLRETNMKFLRTSHPVQIEEFLTNNCIVVENLIKLSKLEEKNLLKVVLLNLPVLTHSWCEKFPFLLRD